jgi:arylsulfatase A-like enzyme
MVMVGKWHLGHADRKFWPRQRGFDYHYGAMVGEIDYFTHASGKVRDWYRDNRPVKEEGYVTQLLGKDAVARIMEHDPQTPLFLYLAFTAPHAPYQAPKVYVDTYKHIEDPTRRPYAAMIASMDDEIGKGLAALAGANASKGKPLDGLNVWASISAGMPSPRQEVVYNIEPFRGGVRQVDWKLIWRTPLPSALELYNIAQDPSEQTNLADKNPQKVAELQKRIEELAKESAKFLFLVEAFAAVKGAAHRPPSLPTEEGYFTQGD